MRIRQRSVIVISEDQYVNKREENKGMLVNKGCLYKPMRLQTSFWFV